MLNCGCFIVVDELPLTGTHTASHHPMQHGDGRHEAAARILSTPDAALVSQIVDSLTSTPADHHNMYVLFPLCAKWLLYIYLLIMVVFIESDTDILEYKGLVKYILKNQTLVFCNIMVKQRV